MSTDVKEYRYQIHEYGDCTGVTFAAERVKGLQTERIAEISFFGERTWSNESSKTVAFPTLEGAELAIQKIVGRENLQNEIEKTSYTKKHPYTPK